MTLVLTPFQNQTTLLSRIAENIGVYQERNETNQSEIVALQITEKYRAPAAHESRH